MRAAAGARWGHEAELGAPAAALAALAESGVFFLGTRLVITQVVGASEGPFATYPVFVILFVAGAFLATRFHRSPAMPLAVTGAAVVAGIIQARTFATAPAGVAFGISIIVGMLVALRIVTLALRDWRNPIAESFGLGALILVIEAFTAKSVHAGWGAVLPIVVPVFFLGSLASRAVSVRIAAVAAGVTSAAEDVEAREGEAPARTAPPVRTVVLLLVGVLGLVLVIAGSAVRGGPFELIGTVARPLLVVAVLGISVFAGAMAAVLGWIGDQFHLDFRKGLEHIRQQLERNRPRVRGGHHGWDTVWLSRTLGVLALALTIWIIVRLIRRQRRPPGWRRRELAGSAMVRATGPGEPEAGVPVRRWRRQDLPRDQVRRWYAETLLLLETRGLVRPPGATPNEHALVVGEAIPESRAGFEALTRGYEQVRYAGARLDRGVLRRLRHERESAKAAIKRARPIEPPESSKGPDAGEVAGPPPIPEPPGEQDE